jgi:hypothetical protein
LGGSSQLETIYLLYWVYHPEKELILMAGYGFKQESQDRIIRLINATNKEWFTVMVGRSLYGVAKPGNKMVILTNWPDENFSANETQGAAFKSLESTRPPYTRDDLASFRQTGDSRQLPQIQGKSYFWRECLK